MEDGSSGKITIVGNTQIGFKEWIILEGSEGVLEIKDGIRFIPNGGEPQPLTFQRPEGYPNCKVDQIVGLAKGQYDTNYTSGINGIRTSWLTNSILETGKGPNERNTVDCDALIEKEGYSRKFLHDLIEASALSNMY